MFINSPLSSLRRLRRPHGIIAVVVVVVISATIGDASDASSRRLHRWEHDLQPTRDDCLPRSQRLRRDRFDLTSKRPDSNAQLYIRCNLPVSYEHDSDIQATLSPRIETFYLHSTEQWPKLIYSNHFTFFACCNK